MSQVLYRKYRSKSFGEIIGQENIISILTESILSANLSHGYLFTGPRGTGKTSIARLLAKAVNCENFNKNKDVCNECLYCKVINEEESMDIIEMDAASNRGIEEIRSMRETVNYMPSSLRKKIYIIDEAHMLTKEAFNALLKTLEEPPQHVIFILATTEAHKLPITILSRVQRYDLNLASQEDLTEKISMIIKHEGREIDNKSLEIIYRKSGGSYRDAESILGKVLSSTQNKSISITDLYESLGIIEDDHIENLLNALMDRDIGSALKLLYSLYEKSGSVNNIIDQCIEKLRERMVLNINRLDKNIYNLTNLFINLKINFKDFNDKLGLMEIELINYCSVNESNQVSAPRAIESTVKVDSVVQESRIVESVGGLDGFISHLITDSKSKFPRLRSILESSDIKLEGDILLVTNNHKFNIIYLDRKDVKSYILEELLRLLAIREVRFVTGEVKQNVNSNVVGKIADPIPSKVETTPIEVKRPKDKVTNEKEQTDNTSLVEGLL